MKNWIFVIPMFIGIFLGTINVIAAQDGPVRQKLKAQRVAFISERIDLMPEEAEKFWPLYNQFEADKKGIHKNYKAQKKLVDMTDKELEQHTLDNFKKEQELLDLKKAYFQKFKSVLPVRKIAMLQVAEKEFRQTIVNRLRGQRKERRRAN